MWQEYLSVTSVEEALQVLAQRGDRARIVAGATDLMLEIERGIRTGIETLVDITRIPGVNRIVMDEDEIIHLAPLVTHNHCAGSKLLVERAFPLARAAWEVGAPQIRNRGTVAGNLITASPANDTITPLMALGAEVTLQSLRGKRMVALEDFYTGVRRTVMQPDEMLVDIAFPALQPNQRGVFIKLGLRRAQAISVNNAAVVLKLESEKIQQISITLGSVAPTIVHARNAEIYLMGRELNEATLNHAAELAMDAASPIDDLRSSAAYRREMVRVCVLRALRALASNEERSGFPEHPIMLGGQSRNGDAPHLPHRLQHTAASPIVTKINGRDYSFPGGMEKTLLHLLRDDAGLTGTKEGCSEGECGACTVYLDGIDRKSVV